MFSGDKLVSVVHSVFIKICISSHLIINEKIWIISRIYTTKSDDANLERQRWRVPITATTTRRNIVPKRHTKTRVGKFHFKVFNVEEMGVISYKPTWDTCNIWSFHRVYESGLVVCLSSRSRSNSCSTTSNRDRHSTKLGKNIDHAQHRFSRSSIKFTAFMWLATTRLSPSRRSKSNMQISFILAPHLLRHNCSFIR